VGEYRVFYDVEGNGVDRDPHRQEGQTHNRGVFDMKVVNIREAEQRLASLIEEAQNEPVCLARQGKPVAVSAGGGGMIWKRSCSNNSRTFWRRFRKTTQVAAAQALPGGRSQPTTSPTTACWVAQQTNLRLTRVGLGLRYSVCCVALTS